MDTNSTNEIVRCPWVKISNPVYVRYHDEEWGKPCHDEHDLYELFILETFQAGLSWECILNKREHFRTAYKGFIPEQVAAFNMADVERLLLEPGIIHNRRKIEASIKNTVKLLEVKQEFGSMETYFWHFTNGKPMYEDASITVNALSDLISKDLKKRGCSFVGSITIYSFLQACGIIQSHDPKCFCYNFPANYI